MTLFFLVVFTIPAISFGRPMNGWGTASSKGCSYFFGCHYTNYGSFGHLHREGDQVVGSSFGGKAGVYNNILGPGAHADVHLASVGGSNGWGEYEANAGKLGANAGVTGVGVDATFAELGGKIGHGPMSIGGKIGLSADTGVGLGKAMLVGTGVQVDSRNGVSFCFLGSCLSVG